MPALGHRDRESMFVIPPGSNHPGDRGDGGPQRQPRRIQGHRTEAIIDILGYRGRDELIHRDDLVLL
jgi:glutamate 5-kinase